MDLSRIYKESVEAYQAGDLETAQQSLLDALDTGKGSPHMRACFHEFLGVIYAKRDQFADAETALREAVNHFQSEKCDESRLANCLNCLGVVYMGLDQLTDAATAYRDALSLYLTIENSQEKRANCLRNLGDVYLKLDQLTDAATAYRNALELYRLGYGTWGDTRHVAGPWGVVIGRLVRREFKRWLKSALVGMGRTLGMTRGQSDAPILFLRGEDVGRYSYWTWEWSDGGEPHFFVLEREELNSAIERLDRALPGLLEEERELTNDALKSLAETRGLHPQIQEEWNSALAHRDAVGRNWANHARQLLMVDRCLRGELASLEGERSLSAELGRLLIPADLAAEIRERAATQSGSAPEVRVLPAPSCVRVPWELLLIGHLSNPDERLLDLARVVTMAPLLARDGDPGTPHPSWESSRAYPPLYVIDPVSEGVGWVLAEGQLEKWQSRVPGFDPETPTTAAKTVATVRQSIDRSWLSRALREPRSRFMYVGHVEATESTAGKTALVLNDPSSMYGLGGKNGRNGIRYLTAQDLYAGTRNPEALFKRLSETYNLSREQAKEREFGLNGIQYPDAAQDDEGNVLELSGSELWPMPPRAALVACHSGADFAHAEPFGLVGAFLESGAELVTATRWVMLTDTAFRIVTSDDPFDAIAVAVDEVQQAEDPNVELARWQRGRLAAWRQSGSIGDSPLSWGAITNYYAPDRTLRAEA